MFTASPTVTLAASQVGQRVTFKAEDGRELVGYFYPAWKPNAPIVVLMHEYGNRQSTWDESAIIPWMQNWGAQDVAGQEYVYAGGRLPAMPKDLSFAVLTFDFRGHGESLPNLLMSELNDKAPFIMDARAAYLFAQTLPGVDASRVIGIGASIGADAVVDACGEICSGAFSVSPGNWLGMEYAKAAQPILARGRPVRCMYAVSDGDAPKTCWSIAPSDLYKIFSYTGIKHGMTFFVPRKMERDFGQNLLEFLQVASR
jgi:dienelactone hydrolase